MHRRLLSSVAPSLRARLWLLVAVVAVPASLLTIWLIFLSYRSERDAMERHLIETVQTYSSLLDAELREREAIVQSLASSTSLLDGDLTTFRARAQRLVTRPDEWLILADASGHELVDTSRPDDVELPRLEETRELHETVHATGRAYVSDLIVSPTAPRHLFLVAMDVRIGAGRDGLLCLAMTPSALSAALLSKRAVTEGVIAVLDRESTMVMRSRNAEAFVGQRVTSNIIAESKRRTSGVADSTTLDGHPSIAAFNVSPENGWLVAVAGLKSELFEPAKQMLMIVLAVAILVGAVVFALAWWVSRSTEAVAKMIMVDTQTLARGEQVEARQTGIVEADDISRTLAETSRELAARQSAIVGARDEAIAASRAKDEFLAALSHELRTPLNPVLLLASEGSRDADYTPVVREIFATIEKNVVHEARLIDDLLDVTRIASGKLALELRPTDLEAAVNDALETLRPRAVEKRLHLHIDLKAREVEVLGDSTRLQQVFANVIGNAMKFTPDGGSVAVTSRVDRARGEVSVDISDSGVGISADEIAHIFERFTQGDHARQGRQSPFGGLGLGLAISRSLVELHGGRIEATSAGIGRGATFRVLLPLPAV